MRLGNSIDIITDAYGTELEAIVEYILGCSYIHTILLESTCVESMNGKFNDPEIFELYFPYIDREIMDSITYSWTNCDIRFSESLQVKASEIPWRDFRNKLFISRNMGTQERSYMEVVDDNNINISYRKLLFFDPITMSGENEAYDFNIVSRNLKNAGGCIEGLLNNHHDRNSDKLLYMFCKCHGMYILDITSDGGYNRDYGYMDINAVHINVLTPT